MHGQCRAFSVTISRESIVSFFVPFLELQICRSEQNSRAASTMNIKLFRLYPFQCTGN